MSSFGSNNHSHSFDFPKPESLPMFYFPPPFFSLPNSFFKSSYNSLINQNQHHLIQSQSAINSTTVQINDETEEEEVNVDEESNEEQGFVLSDEFKAFLAQSAAHRREREALKAKVTQSENRKRQNESFRSSNKRGKQRGFQDGQNHFVRSNNSKRYDRSTSSQQYHIEVEVEEAIIVDNVKLFGSKHQEIDELEAQLNLRFDNFADYKQPSLWPAMALKE